MNIQTPTDPKKITDFIVLGIGTMGVGWVTALLQGGVPIIHVYDPRKEVRELAREEILKRLKKAQEKGKTLEGFEADKVITGLYFLESEQDILESSPDILLEVINEDLGLKEEVLRKTCPFMPENTIFWTNTSCLNVKKMGIASDCPERFVGTHGMNPVNLMPGVEVVKHDLLEEGVLEFTVEFLKNLGKTPFVASNVPGFIVNKVFVPFSLDAIGILERGESTAEDVDKALKLSLGHPQGIFLLLDRIGIDVMIDVTNELYRATQDRRFVLPHLLIRMKEVGNLGFKSGKGFYDWTDPRNPVPRQIEELTS